MPYRWISLLLAAALLPELWVSHGFGMEEETTAPTEPAVDAGALPYPDAWEADGRPVVQTQIGEMSGSGYLTLTDGVQMQNLTEYPDSSLLTAARLQPELSCTDKTEPQVLVLSVHTSESYEPYERTQASSGFCYRTTDPRYDLAAVGRSICLQLEAAGVGAVQSAELFDAPSCIGAGQRCAQAEAALLEEYPSVQAVITVERAELWREDAVMQPVTEVGGRNAAQVRVICGVPDGLPDMQQGLRLACQWQLQMGEDWSGLVLPMCVEPDDRADTDGICRLTLEVGSFGNTVGQAQYAAELAGSSLARVLLR